MREMKAMTAIADDREMEESAGVWQRLDGMFEAFMTACTLT